MQLPEGKQRPIARLCKNGSDVKVALVSSGLGNINRGFEISSGRFYQALKQHTEFQVKLYCGGEFPGGEKLWNFPRRGLFARPMYYVPFMSEQHRWEWTYGIEQVSFWSALNFKLLEWKPDIVWVKDVPLVHLLMSSRAAFGMKFKLVFANGGSFKPQTYKDCDYIQQIQVGHYQQALDFGIAAARQELIGNCLPDMSPAQSREAIRAELKLDEEDYVVVSVAAWNKYHKRIDYLINEIARIADPKVKLVLCGAPEVETESLRRQGQELLGDRVTWLTVPPEKVASVLHAADVFVITSLHECFGNAIAEAAACGMPVVVHPHDGARYIFEDDRWFADLSQAGNLAARLVWLRENPPAETCLREMQESVLSRFSLAAQAERFEGLVSRVLARK